MKKSTIHNFVTFALSFLLAAIAFELVAPRMVPVKHESHRWWGNRPLTLYPSANHRSVSTEYDVRFRTNSLGFKDVEHDIAKIEGTFRVLLLGDSYVEARQVRLEEQTGRLLEALTRKHEPRIEVLSMGTSGYGQAHHLSTYEAVGKRFCPDLVVTFFCTNDIWNNVHSGPYVLENGSLVSTLSADPQEDALMTRIRRRTINRLESYFVLKDLFARFRVLITDPPGTSVVRDDEGIERARIAATGYIEPRPGESAEAKLERVVGTEHQRNVFEKLLEETYKTVVQRDNVEWLNVIVSSDVRSASADFAFLLDWVEGRFEEVGIETINLHEEFSRKAKQAGELPHFDTDAHWNETGHRWVAERLYGYLMRPTPSQYD